MNFKDYIYEMPDGTHYPDARVGDISEYEMDFSDYLAEHGTTLKAVEWSVSPGLRMWSEYLVDNGICGIRLETLKPGSHKVTCKMTSHLRGLIQVINVPMIITVY